MAGTAEALTRRARLPAGDPTLLREGHGIAYAQSPAEAIGYAQRLAAPAGQAARG